jgi:hypothetical protein
VTTYVQDLAGGLPQVLVESTGAVTTEYVYGHDLLAEDGTTWAWHLNDGLSSVRQLADGDGNAYPERSRREILVSNRLAKLILDEGWLGIELKSVELVWFCSQYLDSPRAEEGLKSQ